MDTTEPTNQQPLPPQSVPDIVPDNQFKDIPYYPLFKVDKLFAGFPLFTANPTYTGRQGEVVVVDTGSARRICAYLNGTWRCGDLSTVSGVYSLLAPTPTNGDIASVDGSGNVTDSGKIFDTDGTLAANSDTRIATQKAIKTFAGAANTLASKLIYDGKLTITAALSGTYTMGATYDLVIAYLKLTTSGAGANNDISLQVESDTSNNYNFTYDTNLALATTLLGNRWVLNNGGAIRGQLTFEGKGAGIQVLVGGLASNNTSDQTLLKGNIQTGTNLTTLKFFNNGTGGTPVLNGTVVFYGINF